MAFKRGLDHYLDNVETETKLQVYGLPTKLVEDVRVNFRYAFYDESSSKKMLTKVSHINFAGFSQATRDSLMKQFADRCRNIEFLA